MSLMSLIAAVRPRLRAAPGNLPPATTVVVTPSSFTVEVGATRQLSATVENAIGTTVWESSDPSVATVSATGLVTGISSGSASITAINNGVAGTSSASVQAQGSVDPLYQTDFEDFSEGQDVQGTGANGFNWTGAASVYGVSELLSHSGTRSLRFRWNGQSNSEQRFSFPECQTLALEYYVYFPNGTEDNGAGGTLTRYTHPRPDASNNLKFLTVWADDYQGKPRALYQLWSTGAPNFDSTIDVGRSRGDTTDPWVLYPRTATSSASFISGEADRGRWIQIRAWFRVSDLGQANGEFKLWKDGVQIIDHVNDPWYDDAGTDNYLRNGYLMGWANAAFPEDTSVFIDDFKIWVDSDPGWPGNL